MDWIALSALAYQGQSQVPGALPQAVIERAPLALKASSFSSPRDRNSLLFDLRLALKARAHGSLGQRFRIRLAREPDSAEGAIHDSLQSPRQRE